MDARTAFLLYLNVVLTSGTPGLMSPSASERARVPIYSHPSTDSPPTIRATPARSLPGLRASVKMSVYISVDHEPDEPKSRFFGGLIKNAVRSALGANVQIAAEYTQKNTKGPMGVMKIARQASTGTLDPSVFRAFSAIAKDDAKWNEYCDIIGKGAWITTKSRCSSGLMGLRDSLRKI